MKPTVTAFVIALPRDGSLQVSGLIDVHAKGVERGQGFAVAFWHMF